MSTTSQTTNLFLLEDLEDVSKSRDLAEGDLDALRSVADWIKSYVLEPHNDLIGREGTVCPFLPVSVERKSLWLAPEHIADGGAPQVVELMEGYKRRLLEAEHTDGDVNYNVIAVVFTDLAADRSSTMPDEVSGYCAKPDYKFPPAGEDVLSSYGGNKDRG